MARPGYEHQTFRMQGERSNQLYYQRGKLIGHKHQAITQSSLEVIQWNKTNACLFKD